MSEEDPVWVIHYCDSQPNDDEVFIGWPRRVGEWDLVVSDGPGEGATGWPIGFCPWLRRKAGAPQ